MAPAYTLRDGRCELRWPRKIRPPHGPMRIELVDTSAALRGDAVLAAWEFQVTERPVSMEVDLWCVDLYSVRLLTADGPRLARGFQSRVEGAVPGRLGVQALLLSHQTLVTPLAEIEVTASERAALRRRLERAQVPTIDWFFIELTSHCNFRCRWCPLSRMRRKSGVMPLDRAKAVLDQIRAYQDAHPSFSLYAQIQNPVFLHMMGEPLLYPHLFDVLDYGRSLGIEFCLVTNASLLRKHGINRLLDADLSSIVFSLNAPDPVSFELAASPVEYERVVDQIQEFVAERYRRGAVRPRIELQFLNTRGVDLDHCALVEDPSQVEQQLAFWSEFVRSQERLARVVHSTHQGNAATWPSVLDHKDNDPGIYFELGHNLCLVFKRACNFANALLPKGVSLRESCTGQCPFRCPHRMLAICWDGSSTFCTLDFENDVNLGNVFEQGIEEIWAGERMQRIRRLMDRGILSERICRACAGSLRHPSNQVQAALRVK